MSAKKLTYLGEVEESVSADDVYEQTITLDGKEVDLSVDFVEGKPEYDWVEEYEGYIASLETQMIAAREFLLASYNKEEMAKEYIDFHLEELEADVVGNLITGTDPNLTTGERLLSVMQLKNISLFPGGDSYAVWDYTLGEETDEILVLCFDNEGEIDDLSWES